MLRNTIREPQGGGRKKLNDRKKSECSRCWATDEISTTAGAQNSYERGRRCGEAVVFKSDRFSRII
jgi:hypothetical protein